MGVRLRILGFTQRHRAIMGVASVVLLVGASWLSADHTTLALICVAPVVIGGGIVIVANIPSVRFLESLGTEDVQRFVMETGTDVTAMPQGKRNKLARRWEKRKVPPRLLKWFGLLFIVAGCAALIAVRQWSGLLIVGALSLVVVIGAFRR